MLASTLLLALAPTCFAPAPVQDAYTPVPNAVLAQIGAILPERSNAGASFISDVYSPNIVLTESASLDVVLLWEGAGYRNSLGYFTYRELANGEIEVTSSHLLVADASFPRTGSMQTGDTYALRDADGEVRIFEPGDRIGFFVLADGWNRVPEVRDWSDDVRIPATNGAANGAIGRGCYTTIDRLNVEYALGEVGLARHVAMIWMPGTVGFNGGEPYLLTGFEDLRRTSNSDEDFNDLVYVVSATPYTAIASTPAFSYESGDPDADGIEGLADHYPEDRDRALVTRFPTHGQNVLGVEDQYPFSGDRDYNDVVLGHSFELVTNSSGLVKDVMLTAHLVARGAAYDHRIGLHLPGLPDDATGTVLLERFTSEVEAESVVEEVRPLSTVIAAGKRIDDLFPSTLAALPPEFDSTFTNTLTADIERPCASVRMVLTLDEPVAPEVLGPPPFDLYVEVERDEGWFDIHQPGWPGFAERPSFLPEEVGERSFLDEQGRPWMLHVPTSWRFPLENVWIGAAYPAFGAWASSGGTNQPDWFHHPTSDAHQLGAELLDYVPVRAWSVRLPAP